MSTKKVVNNDIPAKNLSILRKSLDLKSIKMAESLGLKQGSYSDIERGKNRLRESHMIKLAELYDVNLNWLLLNDGPMLRADIGEDPETKSLAEGIAAEVLRLRGDVDSLKKVLKLINARNEWMQDI